MALPTMTMISKTPALWGTLIIALSTAACASGPTAPFDTLQNAQSVTAYRLQNYEPPAQVAAPAAPGQIPGVPPEIQAWIQQGAQGLQQLIPPGLLPPGLIPGTPQQQAQTPQNAPRFHNFRILSQTPVIDPDLKEELAEVLGDEDNFDSRHANCTYSEMGMSWVAGTGQPLDLTISFSCNQVVAHSFAWPHRYTGMKPDTVKKLSDIVQRLFPPGT